MTTVPRAYPSVTCCSRRSSRRSSKLNWLAFGLHTTRGGRRQRSPSSVPGGERARDPFPSSNLLVTIWSGSVWILGPEAIVLQMSLRSRVPLASRLISARFRYRFRSMSTPICTRNHSLFEGSGNEVAHRPVGHPRSLDTSRLIPSDHWLLSLNVLIVPCLQLKYCQDHYCWSCPSARFLCIVADHEALGYCAPFCRIVGVVASVARKRMLPLYSFSLYYNNAIEIIHKVIRCWSENNPTSHSQSTTTDPSDLNRLCHGLSGEF